MVELIILMTALLALTNIAAAVNFENMTIVENGTTLPVTEDIVIPLGESKEYDILISDIVAPQGFEHLIGVILKDQDGNHTTGLKIEIENY